jgi:hypothetical protein
LRRVAWFASCAIANEKNNPNLIELKKQEIINFCAKQVVDSFRLKETPDTKYQYDKTGFVGGGAISYFGVSSHNHPLRRPEYAQIEKTFLDFKPSHVFFEGSFLGARITKDSSKDAEILYRYEMGLTIWLGLQTNAVVAGLGNLQFY